MVASILRTGARGGGPWHMPPHPEISDADARRMARYILALHPQRIEKKDLMSYRDASCFDSDDHIGKQP